ncbi:MAG: polyprenyl synthetase family protein [Parasporobacterium sp.]|nr:polyprenyl synthetase family protein [Parasporobacterium sp.]MBR3643702.1 polyprenyl synthetase family protein [Parasporobacterium sp.]
MFVSAPENTHSIELESANENFGLFRKLHTLKDPSYSVAEAVLRGDYYFSRFSLDLIPVDSIEITDQFAKILREDASGEESEELPRMSFDTPSGFSKGKTLLEKQLKKVCQTSNTAMEKDLERVLLAGGKRLRPALAQAAYCLGEDPKLPILPLMVMIELMHSASLIHDDVVDKGMKRRNVPTINATSGDLAAVRAADFILGRAMELLKIYKGSGINERLAKVSEQMCIGELEQLDSLNLDISEETYFRLIEKKTALFIEAAAATGAVAGGCSREEVAAMEIYGYNIGVAFQIKDDILDFTGSDKFGKETGQDERKGLLTLPKIIGLEAAQARVREYSDKAIGALDSIKNGTSKKAFIEMAKQLENREI